MARWPKSWKIRVSGLGFRCPKNTAEMCSFAFERIPGRKAEVLFFSDLGCRV